MTESISSSVEGQCELEIKRAISLDIADQAQLNQNKTLNKRSFFVRITNLFIEIREKSDCIGQLFIPSYIGYEKFQDNVRFNFFFRVRDSVGYDVSLMPPERLRKRFYKKLENIKIEFENLIQQNPNSEKFLKQFVCNIVIKDKKEEKVTASLESNFLNIYSGKDKDFILIDKIDLSEPGVYVDGFKGFIEHPKNLKVLIYSDNQLRQILSFDKKQVIESQNFMMAVAKNCARYCDKSQNPILKGLEIKNSESNDINDMNEKTSSAIQKTSSIGIDEFREEPKYTKFPQTMKQKMKRDIKSQIKIHKSLFEESKIKLKEIHANQKQIKNQVHNSETKGKEEKPKKEEEEENENKKNDEQAFFEQKNKSIYSPQSIPLWQTRQVKEIYSPDSSSDFNEDESYQQGIQSNVSYKPKQTLSFSKKSKSTSNYVPPQSYQQKSEQNLYLLQQQNNRTTLNTSRSQPNFNTDNQSEDDLNSQDQSKNLPPKPTTPIKQMKNIENDEIPYFSDDYDDNDYDNDNDDNDNANQKTDIIEKPYKEEQMEMTEDDLHQIQIITKSYLMINFRKKYFTDAFTIPVENTKKDNKYEIKCEHEPFDYTEYKPDDTLIEELKEYLRNKEYENLIKKMMNDEFESTDINEKCTKLIKCLKKTTDTYLSSIFTSKKTDNESALDQLCGYFTTLDEKEKLYLLLNEMFELTLKPDFANKEFLDTFEETYFSDGYIIRELSDFYMTILDEEDLSEDIE